MVTQKLKKEKFDKIIETATAKGVKEGLKKGKKGKGKKSFLSQLVKTRKLKRVMKKSNVQVTIKEKEIPSVLEDPNRFFKSKYEEDKRRLFFK